MYETTGDLQNAASTMRPILETHPEFRLSFADNLLRIGETAEGTAMLEKLLTETRTRLESALNDASPTGQRAAVLFALDRPDEARQLLETFAVDPAKSHIPANAMLASLYGQASIRLYDKLTRFSLESGYPSPAEAASSSPAVPQGSEVPFNLLSDAIACPSTADQAIDRLSRLSLSSHPAAPAADRLIGQLRLSGTQGARVLRVLGTQALLANRFDKATHYLTQANEQTRGTDPAVLNNFALTIIRSGQSSDRALELVNKSLSRLPNHPDCLSTRAEIHIAMKHWGEAIADLTEALRSRQSSPQVHRLLQQASTGAGNPEIAKIHGQRAEELEEAERKKSDARDADHKQSAD